MNKRLAGVATDPILIRMRAEYLEMPGLQLTRAQAQRLWGLDTETCNQLLELLTSEHFLDCKANGTYARHSDGAMSFPPPRMASTSRLTTAHRSRHKAG